MSEALYVYAIGRDLDPAVLADLQPVGEGPGFRLAESGTLCAVYSPVSREAFSQEEIDRRGSDLQWLGEIGVRHQAAVAALAEAATIVPLRAFTLFQNSASLSAYLEAHGEELSAILAQLDGRDEWTVRIEFDPELWHKAIGRRVPAVAAIENEIGQASGGRKYLLSKKLDEERARAAREAEEEVVAEIGRRLHDRLGSPMVIESRQKRSGSFPQIDILVERGRREELSTVHRHLTGHYLEDGISLALTGPWPAYTFASTGQRDE